MRIDKMQLLVEVMNFHIFQVYRLDSLIVRSGFMSFPATRGMIKGVEAPPYCLEALGGPKTNKKSPRRNVGIQLIVPFPLNDPRFQGETLSECFR